MNDYTHFVQVLSYLEFSQQKMCVKFSLIFWNSERRLYDKKREIFRFFL